MSQSIWENCNYYNQLLYLCAHCEHWVWIGRMTVTCSRTEVPMLFIKVFVFDLVSSIIRWKDSLRGINQVFCNYSNVFIKKNKKKQERQDAPLKNFKEPAPARQRWYYIHLKKLTLDIEQNLSPGVRDQARRVKGVGSTRVHSRIRP